MKSKRNNNIILGSTIFYAALVDILFYMLISIFYKIDLFFYEVLAYYFFTCILVFTIFSLVHNHFEVHSEKVIIRKKILAYEFFERTFKKVDIKEVIFSKHYWYNTFLGYKWITINLENGYNSKKYTCWFYSFETLEDLNDENNNMIFENLASRFYVNGYNVRSNLRKS